MTESPYAALQPGDQVWLTGVGRQPAQLVTVEAVRRVYLTVIPQHGPVLAVNRTTGEVKDSFRRIITQEDRALMDRRGAAVDALSAAGLALNHHGHRNLSLATLERLAAVIREDTA